MSVTGFAARGSVFNDDTTLCSARAKTEGNRDYVKVFPQATTRIIAERVIIAAETRVQPAFFVTEAAAIHVRG